MTKQGKTPPKELIEHWPEIFSDIKLNVLPIKYIYAILINFKDGKTWEIKITQVTKKDSWESFEQSLSELVKNYEPNIKNIDFKLDVDRVKKDIKRKTAQFLKKKTL